MRRQEVAFFVLMTAVGAAGCSDSGAPAPNAQGGGGGTATGGSTASGTGGSEKGGNTGLGGTKANGGASPGGASSAGNSGAGGGFSTPGACGQRGEATADAASFDGYEETFMISEGGFGDDICVVRFDLKRVGVAPPGCTACTWTHLVELSNPQILTDVGDVCAKSTLGLDAAKIAKLTGSREAIGFAKELDGAHGSARMKYIESRQIWDVFGNAGWDEEAKTFGYDSRDANCNY